MMYWMHNDVGCLNDDLLVGGGTWYALGIVVECLACKGRRFVCLWTENFDG